MTSDPPHPAGPADGPPLPGGAPAPGASPAALDDESDQVRARLAKLSALRAAGVEPYPPDAPAAAPAAELVLRFAELEGTPQAARGRVVALRGHGKTTFLHLEDASGRIQAYVKRDDVGPERYALLSQLDIGDFLAVEGTLFRTKTGEVTVHARSFRLLAKALRPPPLAKEEVVDGRRVAHGGLADKELRYRRRYLDLAVNPEAREQARTRSRIVTSIRGFLDARGFLEVETPVLQPLYGGAAARPFVTHHRALDTRLYLRIADELYLKRLIVGGLERVYEIGKDFRNEGMDRTHNPEFTMLELYQAYADYHDMMEITEQLVAGLVREIRGGSTLTYQGATADVTPPWPRLPFLEAVRRHTGQALDDLGRESVAAAAARLGVEVEPGMGAAKILDEIFKARVEEHLVGPVFITDHPKELSPLAKQHRADPRLVERFESFLFGTEFGNAFTELNDPLDQRRRFEAQRELLAHGDEEAHALDEDFLRALEHGMPPTGGLGIGVDRLVMFLTDAPSIRDVILFPHMRPEGA
ncbi:MAG TPA: lysine--tRNA ligase [Gemmatimonadota bacterium]